MNHFIKNRILDPVSQIKKPVPHPWNTCAAIFHSSAYLIGHLNYALDRGMEASADRKHNTIAEINQWFLVYVNCKYWSRRGESRQNQILQHFGVDTFKCNLKTFLLSLKTWNRNRNGILQSIVSSVEWFCCRGSARTWHCSLRVTKCYKPDGNHLAQGAQTNERTRRCLNTFEARHGNTSKHGTVEA